MDFNVMDDGLKTKIKEVRKEADVRGLYPLVLLTKIDMLCEELMEDVSKTFYSAELLKMVTLNSQFKLNSKLVEITFVTRSRGE